MKGLIIWFALVSILLTTSIIGLGLIIRFPYLGQYENQVKDTCIMTNCQLGDLASCGKTSCVNYHYDYTLMYNGTNYTKTYYSTTTDMKTCSYYYYIDCYYNVKNIMETLTPKSDNGAVLGIFMMTFTVIWLFVIFVVLKVMLITECMNKQKITYV